MLYFFNAIDQLTSRVSTHQSTAWLTVKSVASTIGNLKVLLADLLQEHSKVGNVRKAARIKAGTSVVDLNLADNGASGSVERSLALTQRKTATMLQPGIGKATNTMYRPAAS